MRYTTIIDVTEIPAVWRSHNVTLVYLYLTLKCGYHDDDRDKICVSTRGLAMYLGMTHAAVRHALAVLESAGLIKRQASEIIVTKFVQEKHISARPKKAASVGVITESPQNSSKVNGFLDYWRELEKRAKKGDAEAAAAMERYRGIYEAQMKKS